MRIFLDAMGGDNAPQAPVAGALEALRRFPRLEIVLAGDPAAIEPLLKDGEDVRSRLTVLDAPEVITNHESPVMGVRRKTKSATVIGMLQLRDKEVDGFVSAGSTGAVLAGGMFRLGRIPGIERWRPCSPTEREISCSSTAAPTWTARQTGSTSLPLWAAPTWRASWALPIPG